MHLNTTLAWCLHRYRCGYHTKICVYKHPGMQVPIELPNELAACATHYVAIHKEPPEVYDSRFDVPGTVVARFNLKGIGMLAQSLHVVRTTHADRHC